jgi:hypothetical protein
MSYSIKKRWPFTAPHYEDYYGRELWDYDFIFDKEYEATAFIIGFL